MGKYLVMNPLDHKDGTMYDKIWYIMLCSFPELSIKALGLLPVESSHCSIASLTLGATTLTITILVGIQMF